MINKLNRQIAEFVANDFIEDAFFKMNSSVIDTPELSILKCELIIAYLYDRNKIESCEHKIKTYINTFAQ